MAFVAIPKHAVVLSSTQEDKCCDPSGHAWYKKQEPTTIKRDRPPNGSVGRSAGREQLLFLIRRLTPCKNICDGDGSGSRAHPFAHLNGGPNFIHSYDDVRMVTLHFHGRRACRGGRETASDYTRWSPVECNLSPPGSSTGKRRRAK